MTKRIFDIIFSVLFLILFSPIFLAVMVLILISSPGPVVYKGKRVGLNEEEFDILKFRTMVIDAESKGGSCTTSDDPRITPIGRVLRKTKLDELPQLWNIFRGDMSFVGPRPDTLFYISKINKEDRGVIFSVRPGITDEATLGLLNEEEQLSKVDNPEEYYETVTLPFKVKKQKEYAMNHSLSRDVSIILRTIRGILF